MKTNAVWDEGLFQIFIINVYFCHFLPFLTKNFKNPLFETLVGNIFIFWLKLYKGGWGTGERKVRERGYFRTPSIPLGRVYIPLNKPVILKSLFSPFMYFGECLIQRSRRYFLSPIFFFPAKISTLHIYQKHENWDECGANTDVSYFYHYFGTQVSLSCIDSN